MSDLDLVVADATLRGREGRWRIGIDADRIAVVTQDAIGGREEVDAAGALVTESFVNGHLHLDKVHTLDRVGDAALTAYTAGDMGSARTSIELASAVKADYDRAWIEPNARRAVLEAVRHGVRHVLAFADVDTKARLEGVIPLLALREEFRGVVDLQVVAFPQDGLLCDPGAEELVREAVDLGADVVGGIPWIEHTDADAREHVRAHVRPGRRSGPTGRDAGRRRRRRLAADHRDARHRDARARAGRPRSRQPRAGDRPLRPADAGAAGRAGPPGRPGLRLRPAHRLAAPARPRADRMGIPVALGQDDIEDAYYPFGRHTMVEVAFLAAHALGAFDQPGLDLVYDAVTTTAADVLGVPGHRLEPGGNADLVVHHHAGLREVLAHHAPPAHVVASGKVVASSGSSTTFRPTSSSPFMEPLPVVRVAAVQAMPVVLDVDASLEKAVGLLGDAAALGAQLVVFPETFLSLYPSYAWAHLPNPDANAFWEQFWGSAVEVPGPAVDRLVAACREHDVLCAIGVNEREKERPGSVYNTLLLVGPDGLLSRHRKLMPTHHERLFHGVGAGDDLGVTETGLGRIGGLICWENRMPLARWAVYQGGPQIWLAPTADDSEGWQATIRHIAIESGAFVVSVPQYIERAAFPERLPVAAAGPRGLRSRRCGRDRPGIGGRARRPPLRRGGDRRGRLRPARDAPREALVRRGRPLQPRRRAVAGRLLTD